MDTESKVVRLNSKEQRLINFLRNDTNNELLNALKECISKGNNIAGRLKLNQVVNILENKNYIDLDLFIEYGSLTVEQSEYLIDCMKKNKNIIITGAMCTGKSTLLSALLNYQENTQALFYERNKEINLKNGPSKNDIIMLQETDGISMKDLLKLNSTDKNKCLIIGETHSPEDCLSLISALNSGCSIMTTMHVPESNTIIDTINKILPVSMMTYVKETLEKSEIIRIKMKKLFDGNKIIEAIEIE